MNYDEGIGFEVEEGQRCCNAMIRIDSNITIFTSMFCKVNYMKDNWENIYGKFGIFEIGVS